MVTQSLIQLTDLGVVWKRTPSELFCHVYSYDTGSPVKGARLRLLVDEGRLLGEVTTDANGNSFTPSTYLEGRVTGVVYRDGSAYLKVNGLEIPLSDVSVINAPEDQDNNNGIVSNSR